MADKPSIIIATPSTRSEVELEYTVSLVALLEHFAKTGVRKNVFFRTMSSVVAARNILASEFMATDFSHLLFIDADMGFRPLAVQALIDADKDLVGCIYPFRNAAGGFACAEYLLEPERPKQLTRTKALGMGLTLIKRGVFQTMIDRQAVRTLDPIAKHYGFFDQIDTDKDGPTIQEDVGFCYRWGRLGGEVWAIPGHDISHMGKMAFKGRDLR